MKGYITRKGNSWYAVIYDGLDPATGRTPPLASRRARPWRS